MDTIKIRGEEWAVEANWRAVIVYLKSAGKDSLQEVSNVINLSPSAIGGLMAACINEGESKAGRDRRVTPDLLDDLRPTEALTVCNEFLRIYLAQCAPNLPEEPKKEEAQ